jgi:hypothetical protein
MFLFQISLTLLQYHLVQQFLTFNAQRTPKIINGIQGPLNYQIVLKKMPLMLHNLTFMTSMDPRLRTYDLVVSSILS